MNKNKFIKIIPLFFCCLGIGLIAFLIYTLFAERASFYIPEKKLILSYSDSHLITIYDHNKNKVDNLQFIFSSDNPNVVSVNENGMIYSKDYGEANITITSKDDKTSIVCKVIVVDDKQPFMQFNSDSITLKLNSTNDLFNEILFNNIKKEKISWKSDNTNVVSIDKDGKITAIGLGSTTIYATYEKLTISCKINVINDSIEVTSIKLNKDTLVLEKNSSEKIYTTIDPDNATNRNVVWESSDANIATVDSNGNIFAKNVGSATITAKIDNISAKCNVTIVDKIIKIENIILNNENITINSGDKKQIVATINPKNYPNKKIIWTSSNPGVVKVDENGYVTGISAGSAVITARIDNVTSTCRVTVKTIPVQNISFGETSIILDKGNKKKLAVSIKPGNATNKTIEWSSSNTNVVKVDNNGNIEAMALGTATITAKIDNKTAICEIIVKDLTNPSHSPTLKISTENDSYSISGSKKNISTKYYSNDQNISIHVSSNDRDVNNYAISNSVDGVKTKYSLSQPLSISLDNSSWHNLYVWTVDDSGNYSDYYTNLSIKYDRILLVYDDYSFTNNGGNSTAYGANASSPLKKSGSTYDNYTSEQKQLLNRYLTNKLSKYKSKRNATVAAAKFLTIEFSSQIKYQSLNKYLNKGINFNNNNTCWGCKNSNDNSTYGIQCSGFVAWSLINGGVDRFASYSSPYINSLYLGGYLSPYDWITNFGHENYYSSITDDNLVVSQNNIIDVNSSIPWSKVQEGDLVSYAKMENGKYTSGHVGMIIILSEKFVYVAHASEAYAPAGLQMTRYRKEDFHKSNAYKNGKIILMDEIYKS